ncbi:MAG: hypothetical protein J7L51_02280, partial [Desulfurococcales archaeon]|nr:hypothetical protein [Desulfurococcales archaeon]
CINSTIYFNIKILTLSIFSRAVYASRYFTPHRLVYRHLFYILNPTYPVRVAIPFIIEAHSL